MIDRKDLGSDDANDSLVQKETKRSTKESIRTLALALVALATSAGLPATDVAELHHALRRELR